MLGHSSSGTDSINGGSNTDILTYATLGSAATVDLAAGGIVAIYVAVRVLAVWSFMR